MTKTFEFQESLETLPLPNLEETGEKYLDWIKPLVSEEQFEKTSKILENFMDNEGPILQKKLEQWSRKNDGNWLKPLWDNMYLDIREPVVINVNYFIKIITKHVQGQYSGIEIASVIISKLVDIYQEVFEESLKPEKIKGQPLCMDQYKKMFSATRIPKLNRDEYMANSKTHSRHIVVMYKNNMFKMDLIDQDGNRASYGSIVNSINRLMVSEITRPRVNVGAITTAPRAQGALLLERITSSRNNYNNLEILKDAVFIVCIDEDTKNLHDFAMSLLCSDGDNRYFDKSCQLIFNRRGDIGFNFEHTMVDGTSWVNVLGQVAEELNNIESYSQSSDEEEIELQKLQWDISKELMVELEDIRNNHMNITNDTHMEIINFDDFGKSDIKSLMCSPDAFFHLALQVAQYRTFKKLKSTYESVSTRPFLYGRTECNRPVNMEVLEFVKALEGQNLDDIELNQLMHRAFAKHNSRIKSCQGAKGIERHLFGLMSMSKIFGQELGIDELPEIFRDEGYKTLKHDFISTSRIESKYFDLVGFGPVVPDGFGLWYSILDNHISMCLTTKKKFNSGVVKLFANSIVQSIRDLRRLASK